MIAGVATGWLTVRDTRRTARFDAAQSGIKDLAVAIEAYRDEHGHYPATWDELLSGIAAELKEQLAAKALNNPFKDKFEFTSSSNGFAITVTSSSRYMAPRRIEKKYAVGEALK